MATRFSPIFDPASPQAAAISELFLVTLVICGVVFLIVAGLVGFGLARFRQRPGTGEPRPFFGNRRLEIAWTVVPCLILVWLFVLTARGMQQSDPPASREPDLVVIGHQWWWEVRYPESGLVTANEIHIPTGVRFLVRLESADVIHDFWAPRLARKMDMVPGHPNTLWLEADQPETYLGSCAEFCGSQHAGMRFVVVAQTAADFEAWRRQQLQPARPSGPLDGALARGARLFQEKTCANCHLLQGTPDQPRVAPDLSRLSSRQFIGAGMLRNTPENLVLWLKNPQAVKPSCLMPDLKLSEGQAGDLVNYLEALQ